MSKNANYCNLHQVLVMVLQALINLSRSHICEFSGCVSAGMYDKYCYICADKHIRVVSASANLWYMWQVPVMISFGSQVYQDLIRFYKSMLISGISYLYFYLLSNIMILALTLAPGYTKVT
jgi:hypothetical protein